MAQSIETVQMSVVDHIKNFDIHGAWQALKEMQVDWLEVGIGFALGILAGFLFKRYSKMVFIALIVGTISIMILDYFNFVHIDWNSVQALVGTKPLQEEVSSRMQGVIEWIKLNAMMTGTFGIGFLVGLKVG